MMEQEKLQEIVNNIVSVTNYTNDNNILEYYFKKLKIKVLDYCNREDLNDPLLDFIEDKLLTFATKEVENQGKNHSVSGFDLNDIKTIERGDTTITLRDKKVDNKDTLSILDFNKNDIKVLSRNRKVY